MMFKFENDDLFKINLQLFAEDGADGESANPDESGDVDTNLEDDGNQGPDIEVDPDAQSKDKDNPANHAFAEMCRKMRDLEQQNQSFAKKQKEMDDYYANLARSKGRMDIKTADDYFKAVRAEELAAQYTETQDPKALVELLKESILGEITPLLGVKQEVRTDVDTGLDNEVEEANKLYKLNLKSIDDVSKLPNSDEIINYMINNNMPLSKAYAAANPDKIVAAAKQAVLNQVKGRQHVNSNSNGGEVDKVSVTAADIAQWKLFFPGKSDEQCRKEIVANKKLLAD